MIDLLLVDDHTDFCTSMAEAIHQEEGLRVVKHTGSAEDALDLLATIMVDVVLFDINLGENQMNGVEAAKRISKLYPTIEVILFSWNLDLKWVEKVLESGAACYVEKHSVPEIISSIKKVYNGRKYFRFSEIHNEENMGTKHFFHPLRLSSKEQQILSLMSQGFDEGHIAQKIYCLYATFRIHKRNLMAKLHAINDQDLLQKAFNKKLLSA